jgi:hypothetical protein
VSARDTLRSIRDHFLILLFLIATDVCLKGVLHVQHILDSITVGRLDQILSYFLVFIVLIFAVFGGAELTLHGFKSMRDTALKLYPKGEAQSKSELKSAIEKP